MEELGVTDGSSLVLSAPRNPGGEPDALRVANQEHRAGALRRRRSEEVVDSKIAVRFERHTGNVSVVLDKGSVRFTQQRRKDSCVGVLTDGIAGGKEQTASPDLDTAVKVDV